MGIRSRIGKRETLLRIRARVQFPIDQSLLTRQQEAKAKLGGREPTPLNRSKLRLAK